jgi:hypothetical protein
MLPRQVTNCQDCCLIRDSVTYQLDDCKAANRWRLNQGLFHRRMPERISLLQQVDPLHGFQRVGRSPTLIARFRMESMNSINARLRTTTFISARNLSRLVSLFAEVSS